MNTEFLWGCALIFLGVSIVLKVMFGIAIPTLRLIAGGMLIYAGLSMVMDIKPRKRTKQQTTDSQETIIFQSKPIDLSSFVPKEPTTRDVTVMCGATTLKLNPDVPTEVTITSAGSRTELPDDSVIVFGTRTYATHPSQQPLLNVNVTVVAGSLSIIQTQS